MQPQFIIPALAASDGVEYAEHHGPDGDVNLIVRLESRLCSTHVQVWRLGCEAPTYQGVSHPWSPGKGFPVQVTAGTATFRCPRLRPDSFRVTKAAAIETLVEHDSRCPADVDGWDRLPWWVAAARAHQLNADATFDPADEGEETLPMLTVAGVQVTAYVDDVTGILRVHVDTESSVLPYDGKGVPHAVVEVNNGPVWVNAPRHCARCGMHESRPHGLACWGPDPIRAAL